MFNDRELAIAADIINKGLQRGASQLSSLMNTPIQVRPVNFNDPAQQQHALPEWLRPEDEPIVLLQTDIVGEVGGVCFLVFNQRDAQLLQQKALPAKLQDDPVMGDAVLLETDNIVTAAVVTLFANVLQCQTHGSVPEMQKTTLAQAEQVLREAQRKSALVLDFRTRFFGDQLQFEPIFFWYLNEPFVQRIHQYANQ